MSTENENNNDIYTENEIINEEVSTVNESEESVSTDFDGEYDIYTEKELEKELERKKRQKERRIKVYIYRALIVIAVIIAAIFIGKKVNSSKKDNKPKVEQTSKEDTKDKDSEVTPEEQVPEEPVDEKEPELDLSTLPEDLVAALEFNPELETFARGYAEKKDMDFEIDLSAEAASEEIPLLLQWDERWGYKQYAGEMFGLSGCGPATLSMICINKFHDPKYTPEYIGQFSTENGFVMDGKGSFWTLIGEGGQQLGLDISEFNPTEETVTEYLQNGYSVVCIMGPGEFTQTGHFIILTDYTDGMIKIRDSASVEKSERLWTYAEIGSQIQNAWVVK